MGIFTTVVLSGVVVVYWTALRHINGGMKAAIQIAADGGRLRQFNFSIQPTELTSIWACVIGGAVLCIAPITTDQAVLQRLLTIKSDQDCRQSLLLRSILLVPSRCYCISGGRLSTCSTSGIPAIWEGCPW